MAQVLNDILNCCYTESKYRKQYSNFQKMLEANQEHLFDDSNYLEKLKQESEEIRKERIKLQTANIERKRIDRSLARQEFYYEYIGSVCESLPLPEFRPLHIPQCSNPKEYLCCLSDLHYGASFKSENNEYSPEIFKQRLSYLGDNLVAFIEEKNLSKISIACLGDTLQGILRLSDLQLNDSTVVKSTVEVCRLIASFLNELSTYVKVDYYHVPTANHTQIRPLGSKANELGNEDLEYLIGNYISDLCLMNDRITIHLPEEGKGYSVVDINGFEVIAMHGHNIRNIDTAVRDLSMMRRSFIDYLILGHFHGGREISSHEGLLHDTEVLVCPSFIGSDPYSDTIMKGSKAAAKIYGFDTCYGHTETYKIILN